MKKILKISFILIMVLAFLQVYMYINLMVSEKYETQPQGLYEADDVGRIEAAKIRLEEVKMSKNNARKRFIFLFSLLILLGLIQWFRSNRFKKVKDHYENYS